MDVLQASEIGHAGAGASGAETSGMPAGALVRALGLGVVALAVLAVPAWLLCFRSGADWALSQPYFVVGLGAAVFAAIISVWLNGRIAAHRTAKAGGDAALTARLEGLRLQGLLAAGFGAKLVVVTVGVVAGRAFPLRLNEVASDVKFVDIVSFAVTFAAASLVMQLITATSIARSLRRRVRAT